jgi:hypothetical protein
MRQIVLADLRSFFEEKGKWLSYYVRASFYGFFQKVQAAWVARPIYRALLFIVCLAVFAALFFSFQTSLDKKTIGWGATTLLLLWTAIGIVTGCAVHFVFSTVLGWTGWQESPAMPPVHGAAPAAINHSPDIASHFFAVVGVIYAVLVGFLVATAWQARAEAVDLTIAEQHNVDYLFHLNEAYPSKDARIIRYLLRDYAVDTFAEWAQMAREESLCRDVSESDIYCFDSVGAVSKRANLLAHCIGDLTMRLLSSPLDADTKKTEQSPWQYRALYQEDLTALEGISETRQERRARYKERMLQPILWSAFLLGALFLSGVSYFVSGQKARDQLVRPCALFGMMGIMTAIALVSDRPLAGTTQVDGSGWTRLIRHFNHDLSDPKQKVVPPGYFQENCDSDSALNRRFFSILNISQNGRSVPAQAAAATPLRRT